MTIAETEAYYDALDGKQATRFNLLITIALKLGKPIEGAYDYARMIIESDTKDGGDVT